MNETREGTQSLSDLTINSLNEKIKDLETELDIERGKSHAMELQAQDKIIIELRDDLNRLKSELNTERMNNPFYKELSRSFEEALGPHPTYQNGCWILRIKELKRQLWEARSMEAADKRRMDWLERHNWTPGSSMQILGAVNIRIAIDKAMIEE